jgi:hypothetical protein
MSDDQVFTPAFETLERRLLLNSVNLDADGNGELSALTDGLLAIRFLAGFSGAALIADALAADASRTDPAQIGFFLEYGRNTMLDVDGDGTAAALTDGLLIIRFLAGFSGAALIADAIAPGATRNSANQIETFLGVFIPGAVQPIASLFPNPVLAAGSEPATVVAGDLNGDTFLDIVTANEGETNVVVQFGSEDGTFLPRRLFAVADVPSDVVLGYVDGDMNLDIITANSGFNGIAAYGGNSVSVLLGDGTGQFPQRNDFEVFDGPVSVKLGLINDADNFMDIVTTSVGSNGAAGRVTVLLGNGDGTFNEDEILIQRVDNRARQLAIGLVNNDDTFDVVVANAQGDSISVLLGNGDGTFERTPATDIDVEDDPRDIALADVNKDNELDIVTANPQEDSVFVQIGDGLGGFGAPTRFEFGLAAAPIAIEALDVSGDGNIDLITALQGYDQVAVLLGNGNGTFGSPQFFDTAPHPNDVFVIDIDRDDRLDILVAGNNDGAGNVTILQGTGTGQFFTNLIDSSFSVAELGEDIDVVDVNGDDTPDLVAVQPAIDRVSLLIGTGAGGFLADEALFTGGSPVAVVLEDIDGDGLKDILAANSNSADVAVLLNQGDGRFPRQTSAQVDAPTAIAVGLINNDNVPDAVVISTLFFERVYVLLGSSDGTFTLAHQQSLGVRPGLQPRAVVLGNVDRNNDLDIIVASTNDDYGAYDDSSVIVLLGNGDGTFGAPMEADVDEGPVAVSVGFVDDDTDLDVVTANIQRGYVDDYLVPVSSTVSVLIGNGNGTFEPPRDFGVNTGARDVALGFVDVDGDLDIVTANSYIMPDKNTQPYYFPMSSVSVLIGNGNGTFQDAQHTDVALGAFELALGYVDDDTDLDIVTANTYFDYDERIQDSSVSVLIGNGNGTFVETENVPLGLRSLNEIAMMPASGNGTVDVLITDDLNKDLLTFRIDNQGNLGAARVTDTGLGVLDFAVADFDADNDNDLLLLNNTGDLPVSLFDNDGNNQFADVQGVAFNLPVGVPVISPGFENVGVPVDLAVADINGDQYPDVLVLGARSLGIDEAFVNVLVRNGDPAQDGGNAFDLPIAFLAVDDLQPGEDPARAVAIATANVDNDTGGFDDVLVLVDAPAALAVHLSNGDGTFTGMPPIDLSLAPMALATGLFDGDALTDVVIANGQDNSVSVLQGIGVGLFAPPQVIDVGIGPDDVRVADVDDDGNVDIITANRQGQSVSVLLGRGDGTFELSLDFRLLGGKRPSVIVPVDLDNDQGLDLVIGNAGGNNVSILLNSTIDPLSGAGVLTQSALAAPSSLSSQDATAGATDISKRFVAFAAVWDAIDSASGAAEVDDEPVSVFDIMSQLDLPPV